MSAGIQAYMLAGAGPAKRRAWLAADPAAQARALAVCENAARRLQRVRAELEAAFCDGDLPEPPGWCPVAAIELIEQGIGMLEPLNEDEVHS